MTNSERSKELFLTDLNCAQAVFSTLGPSLGISEADCIRIACGFGAGMGGTQEVCGAVSGAIMLIGSKYGKYSKNYAESKMKVYSSVKVLLNKFREKNISINCKEILGVDISKESGRKLAKETGLYEKKCANFVQDAVKIVEDIFMEK